MTSGPVEVVSALTGADLVCAGRPCQDSQVAPLSGARFVGCFSAGMVGQALKCLEGLLSSEGSFQPGASATLPSAGVGATRGFTPMNSSSIGTRRRNNCGGTKDPHPAAGV